MLLRWVHCFMPHVPNHCLLYLILFPLFFYCPLELHHSKHLTWWHPLHMCWCVSGICSMLLKGFTVYIEYVVFSRIMCRFVSEIDSETFDFFFLFLFCFSLILPYILIPGRQLTVTVVKSWTKWELALHCFGLPPYFSLVKFRHFFIPKIAIQSL